MSCGLEQLYRLLLLASFLGGAVSEGFAPHYAPGVMEAVADRRGLGRSGCMVSSPIYPLGTWLYVYGLRTGALRYCQVVDVSHPRDRARHLRTKRVVELGYGVTRALCGTIKGNPGECPVVVVLLRNTVKEAGGNSYGNRLHGAQERTKQRPADLRLCRAHYGRR